MARVDPDDDTKRRFVAHRYAYDSERRERRQQVLAAFDDASEFEAFVRNEREELARRRRSETVDRRESVGGTVKEPGHDAHARAGHLARRAIEHGVMPPAEVIAEMGSSIAFFRSDDDT